MVFSFLSICSEANAVQKRIPAVACSLALTMSSLLALPVEARDLSTPKVSGLPWRSGISPTAGADIKKLNRGRRFDGAGYFVSSKPDFFFPTLKDPYLSYLAHNSPFVS